MAKGIELESIEEREELVEQALKDTAVIEELLEWLSGASRAKRQKAAAAIAAIAERDANVLLAYADEIAEGLNRPEGQTRWETLRALDQMGKAGQRYGDDVIAAAEDALYDETSGVVREAAFRFFCGYGGASKSNSDEVWPLIDEAIQCYHGNPEFADMLTHLAAFAEADISAKTRDALAQRMKFDSETARGTLRMRSEQIVQACAAKSKKKAKSSK